MMEDETLVLSELHSVGFDKKLIAKIVKDDKLFQPQQSEAVSRFYLIDSADVVSSASGSEDDNNDEFCATAKRRALPTDSTGDLVLRRRPRPPRGRQRHISIRHTAQPTPLTDVALQVWRGACLLFDWLLTQRGGCNQLETQGTLVLELGGGVGLVGVAAAAVCHNVVITDVHRGALMLAAANLKANAALIEEMHGSSCRGRHCRRREGRRGQQHNNPDGGGGTDADVEEDENLVRVDVCELDWFDFLGYGGSSVTVDDIVRALRGDAGPDSNRSRQQDGERRYQGGSDTELRGKPAPETTPGACQGLPVECVVPLTSVSPASEVDRGRVSRRSPWGPHAGNGQVAVARCGGPARVLEAVAAAETLYLIAADTVYDPVLTEAFVKCAATLLSYHSSVRGAGVRDRGVSSHFPSSPASNSNTIAVDARTSGGGRQGSRARLVVSLERRINFVLRDLLEGSPAVDDFMSYVIRDTSTGDTDISCRVSVGVDGDDCGLGAACQVGGPGSHVRGVDRTEGVMTAGTRPHDRRGSEENGLKEPLRSTARPLLSPGSAAELPAVPVSVEGEPRQPLFKGRRLDVTSVPQVLQYERCNQLELWELTLL